MNKCFRRHKKAHFRMVEKRRKREKKPLTSQTTMEMRKTDDRSPAPKNILFSSQMRKNFIFVRYKKLASLQSIVKSTRLATPPSKVANRVTNFPPLPTFFFFQGTEGQSDQTHPLTDLVFRTQDHVSDKKKKWACHSGGALVSRKRVT